MHTSQLKFYGFFVCFIATQKINVFQSNSVAYVIIRQHTSAYVSIRLEGDESHVWVFLRSARLLTYADVC